MPYCFEHSDRTVQKGFRRIARELADEAVSALHGHKPPDATLVHGLRKTTKRLRGLLRLVRPAFSGFSTENAGLRATAALLAPLREAEVRKTTFEKLAADLPELPEIARLRDALDVAIAFERAPERLQPRIAELASSFELLGNRASRWKLDGRDFETLGDGLADSWRKARRGLKAARLSFGGDLDDAEAFHEWRKPVKHHWYQLRLLRPVWPAMLDAQIKSTDELGELLGEHNDIDVLMYYLNVEHSIDEPDAVLALNAQALLARRDLAQRSIDLGAKVFAGTADCMVSRLSIWWSLWREAR